MNPQDLLKLLIHIKVWIPLNNPIRNELEEMIAQLKAQIR